VLCIYCRDREATSVCTTCQRCRSYMHRVGRWPAYKVIEHFASRARHIRLMQSVSVVVSDEEVRYIDEAELIAARVMHASKLKRKSSAVIVSLKQAQALRKRYVEPALANVVHVNESKARRQAS
jgi:hypothetical protein